MAHLTGPLMSLAATGRIGTLLFNQRNGVTHLTRANIPSNPRSNAQRLRRQFLAALSQAWSLSIDSQKSTWGAYLVPRITSPYHAYIHANFARLKRNQWPCTVWPPVPGPISHTIDVTSLTPSNRHFWFWLYNPSGTVPRFVFHRLRTTITAWPGPLQAHFVSCIAASIPHKMHVSECPPGTWSHDAIGIDHNGRMSNMHIYPNVTILD